jgi:phosphatidylserine/phosphatidylglycerophosphate/cardiolipin synthase-like enzyme
LNSSSRSYQPRDPGQVPRLLLFGYLWALLVGCSIGSFPNNLSTIESPQATPGKNDWATVVFTKPESTEAKKYSGGPDQALADAIYQARLSVDVAVYNFNLWSLRDALIAAHQGGVQVRMVTDSDYLDQEEVQELKQAGIPVLGDQSEGFMHNKFSVIDHLEVWSGSMNYTVEGAYRENNNLIRIRSTRLAQDYTTEFEEMFVEDLFGADSPANTPFPEITINDSLVRVYFSPEDHPGESLVQLIKSAQESIYFLAYSFTSDSLADSIIERAQAGIAVSGVLENSQALTNEGGEYDRFRQAELDVRLDSNPHAMHHKVIIIDQAIVVTGSYNFSRNAEEINDENVLVINNPAIAKLYLEEFNQLYSAAK